MKISSRSRRDRLVSNVVLAALVVGLGWSAYLVFSRPLGAGTLLHLLFVGLNVFLLHRMYGRRLRARWGRLLIPLRLRQAGRRNRRSMRLRSR